MEKKVYRSQKGVAMGIIVFLTIGFLLFALIQSATVGRLDTAAIALIAFVILFLLWVWFGTFYRLDDGFLLVCTGPLRWRIPYDKITKIEQSHLIYSSAALSFDRLAIYKNGRLSTLVSPRDKAEFINELVLRCPNLTLS